VLIKVLEDLSKLDPNFLTRFASRKHGRSRRYIAQKREELYPDRSDLLQYSRQLISGWWVGTNYSKSDIRGMLMLASEAANLRFGQDLVVHLGEK